MGKSSYSCRVLDTDSWTQWDHFVKKSSQGSIFQTTTYINTVTQSFGRPAEILVVFSGDEIAGGIVLYPNRKFGFSYVSTPFYIPYNGIIIADKPFKASYRAYLQMQTIVLDKLREALENKFQIVQLSVSPHIQDVRNLVLNGWEFYPEYNISLDLQQTEDLRSLLRRNQRRNLDNFPSDKVRLIANGEIEILYELMTSSYQYHHLSVPLNKEKFLSFCRNLIQNGLARCFLLKNGGQVLSAMLTIEAFPVVYTFFAGRKFNTDYENAELYLYWKLMESYKNQNFKIFDFLGGMVPSIAYVKLGLGGYLRRYDRVYYYRHGILRNLYKIYHSIKLKKRKQ